MMDAADSRCRLIRATDAAGWLRAIEAMPHEFGHRPEYAHAATAVTGLETALWVYEGVAGRAACVVGLRDAPGGFDIATPLGFAGFATAGDVSALGDAWTADWKHRGAIAAYVQLSPFLPPSQWRQLLPALAECLQPARDCWCWDLRPEPDALLAAMSSKHRQLLRRWLREAARVEWDQSLLLAHFNELYAEFLKRQSIASIYHYHASPLALIAAAPGSLLVGARNEHGDIEAVTMFLYSAKTSDSFLNAATVAGRRHSRGLYWLGALRLRELGVQHLNLGGGIVPGDGLSDFKDRLGASRSSTLALKQVFDRHRYVAACETAGVPADETGYFPAWRKPFLQDSQPSRKSENACGEMR